MSSLFHVVSFAISARMRDNKNVDVRSGGAFERRHSDRRDYFSSDHH